jgi:hypothetical protein
MELLVRSVLIVFAVGIAVGSAYFMGHERADIAPMKALQSSVVTYGLMGAGVVALWPTPDVWSTVGKCTVLGLFALELGRDALALKWPRPPVFTPVTSWTDAISALLMLVCVVFLWP